MQTENAYYHALNLIPGLGPLGFRKLRAYFSKVSRAWAAPLLELKRAGLPPKLCEEIIRRRAQIDPQKELAQIASQNISLVTIADPAYPRLLKEIYAPPALLYLRGTLPAVKQTCFAVVGTRKPSSYGRQVTFQLVGLLAQTDLVIVSGLALGIDALAHQACLDFNGQTIAVLGSGVDDPSLYPRSNFALAQRILRQNGALLSEYPPGTSAQKQFFPQRNRIIAGLSCGVLIIEAGERSGALITAHAALDQNREIFAIPGSIYNPNCRGTNNLIQKGAKLVTQVQDILDELNLNVTLKLKAAPRETPRSPQEALLCRHLSSQPTPIDVLARKTNLPAAQLSVLLTLLEMKGMVRNVGAANYTLLQ